MASALPADVSAGARLLALQCALRMNACLRVQLSAGLLRGLRIDAAQVFRELERSQWLSVVSGPGPAGTAVDLRDALLLGQPPARPDRRRAADWALRRACPVRMRAAEPRLQLLGVCLAAHSDPSSGDGQRESERLLRECGMPDQELAGALARLTDSRVLEGWRICPESGDAHWTFTLGQ
ncbi:hypothetical protein ACFC00_26920 [Streptomyces adustus]|uniref:hypothetical protein n=1 Tax=Streptomyces adustus TaxID=1609272 RepID=UPI0035DB800A